MNIINIEMSFDNNRVRYVGPALYSVLKRLDPNYAINLYLITSKVSDKDLTNIYRLKEHFKDKLLNIYHEDFDAYNLRAKYPIITYVKTKDITAITLARLYTFDIFPDVDYMLHLDEDILCLASIHELWEERFKGALIVEPGIDVILNNPNSILNAEILLKNNSFKYSNIGIHVLDLNYYRQNNILDKCIDILKEDPNLPLMDESLFNCVFSKLNSIYRLPNNQWNKGIFNGYGFNYRDTSNLDEFCKQNKVKLFHYCGGYNYNKPWNYKNDESLSLSYKMWYDNYAEYLKNIVLYNIFKNRKRG